MKKYYGIEYVPVDTDKPSGYVCIVHKDKGLLFILPSSCFMLCNSVGIMRFGEKRWVYVFDIPMALNKDEISFAYKGRNSIWDGVRLI